MTLRGSATRIICALIFIFQIQATAQVAVNPLVQKIANILRSYQAIDASLEIIEMGRDLQLLGWSDKSIENSLLLTVSKDIHLIYANKYLLNDATYLKNIALRISEYKVLNCEQFHTVLQKNPAIASKDAVLLEIKVSEKNNNQNFDFYSKLRLLAINKPAIASTALRYAQKSNFNFENTENKITPKALAFIAFFELLNKLDPTQTYAAESIAERFLQPGGYLTPLEELQVFNRYVLNQKSETILSEDIPDFLKYIALTLDPYVLTVYKEENCIAAIHQRKVIYSNFCSEQLFLSDHNWSSEFIPLSHNTDLSDIASLASGASHSSHAFIFKHDR